MNKQTVVVGMSGGVDSSVAALLLKNRGCNVIGLFMDNWEEETADGHCCAEEDYADVRAVCSLLEIPYYSVNFAREYKDFVFKHFLEEYARGRTPNPDVLCNREIKFASFLTFALKLGADKIATGHYCGVAERDGKFYLAKARDADKDQTYFLNQLSQTQLSYSLFPLQGYLKSEVRAIAKKNGVAVADKKDSTGICFIGERKFKDFLKGYLPANPGDIVDADGNFIGRHDGLPYYTKGQRRGLGIGGGHDGDGRWFVIDKELARNELIVSCGERDALFSQGLIAPEINWIPEPPPGAPFKCRAKMRYRQEEQEVTVTPTGKGARVDFAVRQRAVTEGQYVVFYDESNCIGGGVIDKVF